MLTRKEIAEVYRLGILIGFHKKEDAIKWADSIIKSSAKPDYPIIELSMSANKLEEDVAALLHCFEGECNIETSIKVLLGLMANRLEENVSVAQSLARMLYVLLSITKVPDDEYAMMMWFDDEYELLDKGVLSSKESLTKELADFLGKYKDYSKELLTAA